MSVFTQAYVAGEVAKTANEMASNPLSTDELNKISETIKNAKSPEEMINGVSEVLGGNENMTQEFQDKMMKEVEKYSKIAGGKDVLLSGVDELKHGNQVKEAAEKTQGGAGKIAEGFKDLGKGIGGQIKHGAQGIVSGAQKGINKVTSVAKEGVGRVKNAVKGLKEDIKKSKTMEGLTTPTVEMEQKNETQKAGKSLKSRSVSHTTSAKSQKSVTQGKTDTVQQVTSKATKAVEQAAKSAGNVQKGEVNKALKDAGVR